jgi:Cu/Ag efflux protein CusF
MKKEVKQKMIRAIAIIAVIMMFALTGVTLATAKTKRAAHILSGEVVSIDATAGTVTVKLDDPKELSQLKEGDKVAVKHAKTSAPAPAKSETTPMKKPMSTPKPME